MKKTIFILILASFYLSSFAYADGTSGSGDINYIVNAGGVKYFKKMRVSLNGNLIAKTENGEKVVFDNDNIKSYRINGEEYRRKFVVEAGSNQVKSLFLQHVRTTAGYSLFKKAKGVNEPVELSDFYVYKDDVQMYQLNEDNYKVILSFFFPEFNLKYFGR